MCHLPDNSGPSDIESSFQYPADNKTLADMGFEFSLPDNRIQRRRVLVVQYRLDSRSHLNKVCMIQMCSDSSYQQDTRDNRKPHVHPFHFDMFHLDMVQQSECLRHKNGPPGRGSAHNPQFLQNNGIVINNILIISFSSFHFHHFISFFILYSR